jgi:hypothetical protein
LYGALIEGGSANIIGVLKTPVIIANTGHRKGLSRKLGCGKIAPLFLHIPTSRGDRSASPPDFPASYFSRKFSDLETPIYRAPLYLTRHGTVPRSSFVSLYNIIIPKSEKRNGFAVLYSILKQ